MACLGKAFGLTALLIFAHLWWRSGEGLGSGPFFEFTREHGVAWDAGLLVAYFTLHSVLATDALKQRLNLESSTYRRFYLACTLATTCALWIAWQPISADRFFSWEARGIWRYSLYFIQATALVGFAWTARSFDLEDFFGARSAASARNPDEPSTPFVATGPFALCRHPSYFFGGMLLISSPIMPPGRAVLTACSIAYFVVGSLLEERKLMRRWGAAYERYRMGTPWLIPTPRSLRKAFG